MKKSLIWGKIPLQKDSVFNVDIQDVKLSINSDDNILSYRLFLKNDISEDVSVNRVIGKSQDMFLLPALPDRPIILKPKTSLSILPSTTFKFFIYLPVSFQLYSAVVKPENKIFEYASNNLSSTWFGEPNDGELCYALYTSFDTEINKAKIGNDFVICPVEISNSSKETLEVKRLAVRCIHLNIYSNDEIMISNKVKIGYNGYDKLSDVQFSRNATTSIPKLKQIAGARIPEGNTVLKRSFQLIRHITQF